jgi:medium-chain acyl-[acyl-carrier-protein] hydrolase
MDEVKIQSWGKKQHKLYSMRDYLMLNSRGKIICKGTSAWLLLDIKTLRPKILTELYPDLKMLDTQDALFDLPQKIKPRSKLEEIFTTEIRYSAIDLNQHTNK